MCKEVKTEMLIKNKEKLETTYFLLLCNKFPWAPNKSPLSPQMTPQLWRPGALGNRWGSQLPEQKSGGEHPVVPWGSRPSTKPCQSCSRVCFPWLYNREPQLLVDHWPGASLSCQPPTMEHLALQTLSHFKCPHQGGPIPFR